MIANDAAGTDSAVLAEINITPFTDVLLVLLIIFMILAALVLPPGFERQFAPCACTSPSPHRVPKAIDVVVTGNDLIFVDGKAIAMSALYAALAQIHARSPHSKLNLFTDPKAPYGTIIRVLDAAKIGGLADVAFVSR